MDRHRGRYHPRPYHIGVRSGRLLEKAKHWIKDKVAKVKKVKEKIESNPLGRKVMDRVKSEAAQLVTKAHEKLVAKVGEEGATAIENVLNEGINEATRVKLKGGTKCKATTSSTAPPKRKLRRIKTVKRPSVFLLNHRCPKQVGGRGVDQASNHGRGKG